MTEIKWEVFRDCSSLQSVDIPDSVTEIEDGAFEGCTSLPKISVSRKNSCFVSVDGVLYDIDKKLLIRYPAGRNETACVIPASVTEIGWRVFYGCTSLQSVDIPDSVTVIGWSAFEGCSSLQSVVLPDSVTVIGRAAFRGCSSLQSVDIADSVTKIMPCAFLGCTSLQSVDIPASVTEIGGGCIRWLYVYKKSLCQERTLVLFL